MRLGCSELRLLLANDIIFREAQQQCDIKKLARDEWSFG
jgi:hypothetical protein